MPRLFTHKQAELLLPEVEHLLRAVVRERDTLATVMSRLAAAVRHIEWMGGVLPDRAQLSSMKRERDSCSERLRNLLEQLTELGVQVKDLEKGLVDFPTLYRGEEVLMCWRLGESGISWWHGAEEGFQGRKKIDREFLANHAGDTSH